MTTDTVRAARDAAVALLSARASALNRHDRAAFAATLDSSESEFGRRQLAAFDAYAALPVTDLAYGSVTAGPALTAGRAAVMGGAAWVVSAQGSYRFTGYDPGTDTFPVFFTIVRRRGTWRIIDDADGPTQHQPWDLRGMTVVRSATALVVGNVPVVTLRRYLAMAGRAVASVSAVWHGPWRPRIVIVAPSTAAETLEMTHDPQATQGQVAASTEGEVPPGRTAPADRIVVNPAGFQQLAPLGQQVVLTHESTHVAVRSTTVGRVPLWLSEGFADYVGYRSVGVPEADVAAPLLALVRASGVPTRLPEDSAFDPARGRMAVAYNEGWLAVTVIADRVGVAGLTRFYRGAVSTGDEASVAAAWARSLRVVAGLTPTALTQVWQARIRRLAAA